MKKSGLLFSLLSGLFLTGLFSPGYLSAQTDTLSFLHLTDTHVLFNPDFYQKDFVQSRKSFSQGIDPLRQFLHTVPAKINGNFVAITGDLVDFFEAETQDGPMLGFQVEQFSGLIGESPVPVFLTLGNHDITWYKWKDTQRVSSQSQAGKARATWIRNLPCFSGGTWYSRIYKAGGTTYRLIFLENAYNTVHPGENINIPYLDRPQLHWLEDQVRQSPDDIEIILMHLPFTIGANQKQPASDAFKILAGSPSVKLILVGHNHRNVIRSFDGEKGEKLTMVQTGSFGLSPENWRVIRLTKDKILVSQAGKTETELTISIR